MDDVKIASADTSGPVSVDQDALAVGAEIEEYRIENHEQALSVALENLKKDPNAYASINDRWNQRLAKAEEKKTEVYYFRMDNQPGNPWRPYYVMEQHSDEDEMALTSIPPEDRQEQAEHFRIDQADLRRRIQEGSIRSEMPQSVEQVQAVDPDAEFDMLIKLRDELQITPEQFNERSKRLFGFRQNWLTRRSEFSVEEAAGKVLASYKRDRSMGLDHETALQHAMGNWMMLVNMQRHLAGQEDAAEAEIASVRQRAEQMVMGDGGEGGGGNKPEDWVIAHILPAMERTASGMWRAHVAKAKKNPAYEKETTVIRENKKKPEAKKHHDFKPAKWTHPNGHPRCLLCGNEETIGGVCNKTPTAADHAEFQAELDAEFPEQAEERLKKGEKTMAEMYERGEITHTEFHRRVAMTDETERLLGDFYEGKITQGDLDQGLRRLRTLR